MALKTFRPLTPSLRYTATSDFAELTKSTPEKSLTYTRKRTGGRNNNGRMTSRHRGGGHKRKIRIIDWRRRRTDPAKVIGIEYDPNRSANLALLEYESDKHRAYIIAPKGLTAGDTVRSGADAEPSVGNCLPLHAVPLGMEVHNLELTPGRGGQIVRSAGGFATMMGLNKEYAQVKLPSGEIRMLHRNCTACIGQVGNVQHENIVLGKAGRSRWLGRRPHVRGMAMNPVDHPNGGGEGRSKSGGGRRHPVSPWGQLAKGLKTRTKHKPSNRFIIERRKKKK